MSDAKSELSETAGCADIQEWNRAGMFQNSPDTCI